VITRGFVLFSFLKHSRGEEGKRHILETIFPFDCDGYENKGLDRNMAGFPVLSIARIE
jgi:hypothetical protein